MSIAFIAETDRVRLRPLRESDAPFLLELLNEPDWLRYIGDRGVRTVGDAENYVRTGPLAMYERHGFGLWALEAKAEGDGAFETAGICGLLKRDTLDHADIGFAMLARHRRRGLTLEAANLTMDFARRQGMKRVLAITSLDNEASGRLLERLGFRYEETRTLAGASSPVKIYGWSDDAPDSSLSD
jgi:ribosomal-protein-alanine N-acetyltransferase